MVEPAGVPIRKALLVAGVQAGLLVALRVYEESEAILIEQPKKVATPLTTVRVRPLVQDSVPPAGFVAMARLTTVELSVVTTRLEALRAATAGCWSQIARAPPPPG